MHKQTATSGWQIGAKKDDARTSQPSLIGVERSVVLSKTYSFNGYAAGEVRIAVMAAALYEAGRRP